MGKPPLRVSSSLLEKIVVGHASVYLLMSTWMFGGRIYWAYLPLLIWGLMGAVLTGYLWIQNEGRRLRHLVCLFPLLMLTGQVLASTINPSFEEIMFYDQRVLRPIEHANWAPSSADPARSFREWGLYVGLFLSAYNLFIGVRTRRSLRIFATVAVLNGGVLAVFGTVQKLVGADIFFGLQESPNPAFFATFIYHNHWGAYAVLSAALCLALAAHHFRRIDSAGLQNSPALILALPVLPLAISVPLSTSRSSSLLIFCLLLATVIVVGRKLQRRYRGNRRAQAGAMGVLILIVLVPGWTVNEMAGDTIRRRLGDTIRQVSRNDNYSLLSTRKTHYTDSRFTLYADTLRMFREKPLFGWGFGSYGLVFKRFDSQYSSAQGVFYEDAHSDWLEALAEIGWLGTGFLLSLAAGPLWLARRMILRRAETGLAFLGTILIVAYAAIEFPFANPAVVLTFWCTFFYAVRTAQINEMNQAD